MLGAQTWLVGQTCPKVQRPPLPPSPPANSDDTALSHLSPLSSVSALMTATATASSLARALSLLLAMIEKQRRCLECRGEGRIADLGERHILYLLHCAMTACSEDVGLG